MKYDRRARVVVERPARRRPSLLGLLASVGLLFATCGATTPARVSAEGGAPAAAATSLPPDPGAVLRWCGQEQAGTRELANELLHRQREIEEREQTLAGREAGLAGAETRLDTRIAELEALRKDLAARLDAVDRAEEERLEGLVKMVETNRASSIAPMVASLEPELATKVLDRMSRQKAGKLLAALPPAKAAQIAERMTRPIVLERK